MSTDSRETKGIDTQSSEDGLIVDGILQHERSLRGGRYQIYRNQIYGDYRIILQISADVMKAIGGRDVLCKQIFPEVFDGSYPAWGECEGDGRYRVELKSIGMTNQRLVQFMDLIDRTYDHAMRPTVSNQPSAPVVAESVEAVGSPLTRQSNRWRIWNLFGKRK